MIFICFAMEFASERCIVSLLDRVVEVKPTYILMFSYIHSSKGHLNWYITLAYCKTTHTHTHTHTYIYIYIYIYVCVSVCVCVCVCACVCVHLCVCVSLWVVFSPMTQETRVQSQVESYQILTKWYFIPPCLTLSIIRYLSRVMWGYSEKRVVPSRISRCSSNWKRSHRIVLDYGYQLYLYIYIYIYIYIMVLSVRQ